MRALKEVCFSRTVPASTKNAINLNKLATLVGENDEDLDLDLLAKKLKEFDDEITETHMKRVNSLKNRCVINMATCGMQRSQSLKGDFLLIFFSFFPDEKIDFISKIPFKISNDIAKLKRTYSFRFQSWEITDNCVP